MGRPTLHPEDVILDAARDLVLNGGARAATLNAIAARSGAPKGSLYHRFPSLNDLLATMWVRAVERSQRAFLDAVAHDDAEAAAIAGALSIHDFAKKHPADARLLASVRREDLVDVVDAPKLRRRLAELNRPVEQALVELARRLYGRAGRENVERTACAVVDLPIGATRRHLIAGTAIPRSVRGQLEAAVRAALAGAGAARSR